MLRLWMYDRIAINFGGGGLKDLGLKSFRKPQHVDGAVDIHLGRLDRVVLIMDRRGRTGQVIDFVHLHIERKGDVMAKKFKIRGIQKM
jgi:hypothetical protein